MRQSETMTRLKADISFLMSCPMEIQRTSGDATMAMHNMYHHYIDMSRAIDTLYRYAAITPEEEEQARIKLSDDFSAAIHALADELNKGWDDGSI